MKMPQRVAVALVALAILLPAWGAARTMANLRSLGNTILWEIVERQQHLVTILRAQVSQLQEELKQLVASFSYAHASPTLVPMVQSPRFLMSQSRMAQTSPAIPSVSVTTSADGEKVHQGDTLTISWKTSNAPAGSAIALFPEKAVTGRLFDPIATSKPTSGSYTWQVPIFVMLPIPCAPDITGGCVGSMNPGTTYKIVARLYTPGNADFVEFGPTKAYPIDIAAASSAEFTMLAAP
jgi:hypothetical protein